MSSKAKFPSGRYSEFFSTLFLNEPSSFIRTIRGTIIALLGSNGLIILVYNIEIDTLILYLGKTYAPYSIFS